MTLIISIIKPDGIWQSADYRLTVEKTGRVITDRSVKQLVDQPYPDGGQCALISYTGIGRLPREERSVSKWLIQSLRGRQRPVFDSLDAIARLATERIGNVSPHWFVAAGFRRREPWFAKITNMPPNAVLGDDAPEGEFVVYPFNKGFPRVFVSPSPQWITVDDLELLRHVAAPETRPRDNAEFLALLASINRRAHEAGADRVSYSSSTVYLPPDCIDYETQTFGGPPDLRGPLPLSAGLDISELIDASADWIRALKRGTSVDDEELNQRLRDASRRAIIPEVDLDEDD